MRRVERFERADRIQRALPFDRGLVAGPRQDFEAQRRFDRAGDEIGALHRARQPEKVVGGAGEHGSRIGDAAPAQAGARTTVASEEGLGLDSRWRGNDADETPAHPQCALPSSSSSTTQVSFVPPPWLELTTSEPSTSATRVKPPGTIFTPSVPVSANGRRSTWRGETPLSNEAGQVDSGRVGWAMKLAGLALSLAAKISRWA